MQIVREVNEKGQLVLPKDVRDYLNIRPRTKVVIEVRNNEIVIKPNMSGKEFIEYFSKTTKKTEENSFY